jgi:hypothetical protein
MAFRIPRSLPSLSGLVFPEYKPFEPASPSASEDNIDDSSPFTFAPERARAPSVRKERSRSPSPASKKHKGHKPVNVEKLKGDGANYDIWLLKIGAALRFAELSFDSEILNPVKDQLGRDILLDAVDNSLAKVVYPKGRPSTTFKVLETFRQMFGMENASYHATIISQLWTLAQQPGEDVQSYGTRASALLDKLERAGGDFSPATFLQCFSRGVAAPFKLTVRFLQQGPSSRHSYHCLMGDLLAEEASISHEASLHKQQLYGAAGAVTETGKREWRPSSKAATTPGGRGHRDHNPNCWNCNQPGHSSRGCLQPQVRPWPFAPAGYVPRKRIPRPAAGAGAAAGAAPN